MDRDFNSKDLYYFKADKLKITCEEEVPWTLDGEFGGNEKEVIIENIQEALELAVK
jgi:diacylglycerol kinase family enzyme